MQTKKINLKQTKAWLIIALLTTLLAVTLLFMAFGHEQTAIVAHAAETVTYHHEFLIGGSDGAYTLKRANGSNVSAASYTAESNLMSALNSAITAGNNIHLTFDGTEDNPVVSANGYGFEFTYSMKACNVYIDGHVSRSAGTGGTANTLRTSNDNVNFYIIGGTIKRTESTDSATVYSYRAGSITVNGGTVYSEKHAAIHMQGSGSTLTVNSGTVHTDVYNYAINNQSGCTVIINGGTIRGYFRLFAESGTLTINGGKIESAATSAGRTLILNTVGATVTVGGKTVTGTANASVTMPAGGLTYNGNPQTPASASYNFTGLTKGTDYTEDYTDNTNAGTAKFNAYIGDYITFTTFFEIAKQPATVAVPSFTGTLCIGSALPALSGATDGGIYTLDEGQTLNEGKSEYDWLFIPDEGSNYEYSPLMGKIELTVESHNLTHTDRIESGCSDGNIEYWQCDTCGRYFDDNAGTSEITQENTVIKAQHNLILTTAVAATCTTAGNSTYWTCSECGKYFSDAAGTTEIAEDSWIIAKLAHTLTKTEATAATCITAGNSAYWTCSECGKYFSDAAGTTEIAEDSWIIAKLAHTLTKTEATAATCITAGNSAYWTCSECGKYFSDAAGTDEIAEDSWIIPALGHDYGAWAVTTAPTTAASGVLTRTCSHDSSHTETQILPALNTTDYTYSVMTAATNEAAGMGRYTWKETAYGTFYFDVSIPATGGGTDNPPKDGLSGGAIAGIVMGSVLVVAIGGFAVFWFIIKKKTLADLIAVFKKKQ